MTNVLISGFNQKVSDLVTRELNIEGNIIFVEDNNRIFEQYGEILPDVLILNIGKGKSRLDIIEKIMEFDYTACIFAVVSGKNSEINDALYKYGVRVILETPDQSDKREIERFVKQLYNSCNDLEHEKCIGCWKTSRFDNLTQLN